MSNLSDRLKELLAAYPLPSDWRAPEIFAQELALDNLVLPLAGLSTQGPNGLEVTGSAAGDDTAQRCFFELLERIAIVEAEGRADATHATRDASGSPVAVRPRAEIFPESPTPQDWRYAKSNGVAAHLGWEHACVSALCELIERDRLLRSWYGETPPRLITSGLPRLPDAITARYEMKAYAFDGPNERDQAISVVGLFGFPKAPGLPRIYGSGSRWDVSQACVAAARECLQGFGFLYGEDLPTELPAFAPHPLYHQELFLHADGIAKLRAWLAGDHRRFARPSGEARALMPEFADLTPEGYRGRLHVVKALSEVALPLTFGAAPPPAWSDLPKDLWVHPIT